MVIYCSLAFGFLLLSLLEIYVWGGDNSLRVYKTAALWAIGTLLVCITGLRYMVGADYTSYRDLFEIIGRHKSLPVAIEAMGVIEPGYVVVNYLMKGLPYNAFLFCFALPAIFLKLRLFRKYSPYVFLSLLLYLPTFLEGDMGTIRQHFALALIFFSIEFIVNRKLIPFLLTVLVAFMFHRTAIIFLPAYFLARANINYWIALVIIFILQFTSVLSFEALIHMTGGNKFITGKVMDYAISSAKGEPSSGGLEVKDLARLVLIVIIALNQKMIRQDKLTNLFCNLFIWGCLIYLIFKFNTFFAQRLTLYYLRLEIMLIPMLLYGMYKEARTSLRFKSYAFFFLFYAVLVLVYKIYILIPFNSNYQFIFWAN